MSIVERPIVSPKRLIEVAIPLDSISAGCEQEKNPFLKGHPRAIHLWWARRPISAARAVLFAQLVYDPEDLWRCQNPGVEPNKQHRGHWTRERSRLFKIIEDLVQWENTTNAAVIDAARVEIRRSWQATCELNRKHPEAADIFNPDRMPGLHDPFAGGGAIPLEAQRLGLDAYASDLNPVAVLINKAMIEIPPKFSNRPPVHPDARAGKALFNKQWKGADGLSEDVRRYGQWIRDVAATQIGHLYPKVMVTKEMAKDRPDLKDYLGQELPVIAWLWARTVKSPNPAFSHVDVPLASTFILSNKQGKEAYVSPVLRKDGYEFAVKLGTPPSEAAAGTTAGKRQAFRCLMSDVAMGYDYIRNEGKAGRMGQRLLAIVAEGSRGRIYLPPTDEHETAALAAVPTWRPDCEMPKKHRNFQPPVYGMDSLGDIFTDRQLVALSTFCDLVVEAKQRIEKDVIDAWMDRVEAKGALAEEAAAYAESVCAYLACGVGHLSRYSCTICGWNKTNQNVAQAFGRQAIPMTWDFAEANPLVGALSIETAIGWPASAIPSLGPCRGSAIQSDAQSQELSRQKIVCTDPPYYDNIAYAELSDFFYVWLRRALRGMFTDLFATIATPKVEELIASATRFPDKRDAEAFFLAGMTTAMTRLASLSHPGFPVCIYYAFKQSETDSEAGTSSTGWEVFLDAVLRAGFSITGTWPMRTERTFGLKGDVNALASSIVLACRPRSMHAGTISRRQFVRMLNESLPAALDAMTRESEGLHSPVAPVDLSQAIIGPGMAIFSRYEAVLEADGTRMTVKTALQLINRFLAEDDFDADTQFCLHWFEQYGWDTGKFGDADTLARAKGTSVDGVKQSGVVEAGSGNVRLLRWKEYPADWDARSDSRLPVWEALHQLIRAYQTEGDAGASKVLAAVASKAETSRQLAYRLYTLCERKGWAEEARAYNEVVTGWSSIETAAAKIPGPSQGILFDSTKETP
jgi:putative DNA methylase